MIVSESTKNKIKYIKDGNLFIIKFCCPETLNAMDGEDYIYLASLLDHSDKDPEVYFTILQSSGRYFSSGADFSAISKASDIKQDSTLLWLNSFLSRNTFVSDKFYHHSKILVCCLNGPAIGFSAALVALCDIVYSMNDKVFLLYPFANLGLVTEGCTAITLPLKLGNNITYEKLIFSEPIKYDILKNGIINKNYDMDNYNEFNELIINEIKMKSKKLYKPSLLGIKKLIMNSNINKLSSCNADEVNDAMKFWIDGEPVRRFVELKLKRRTNRL